jgi:hypothetical protein
MQIKSRSGRKLEKTRREMISAESAPRIIKKLQRGEAGVNFDQFQIFMSFEFVVLIKESVLMGEIIPP